MTARDELALLLINTQRSRYSLPPRETTEHCSETCWAEVDAILAAGYRKPPTIENDKLVIDGGMLLLDVGSCTCTPYGSSHEYHCGLEYLDDLTKPLERAGYRKPRTITTAEELDALPSGSVIIDSSGEANVFHDNGWVLPGGPGGYTTWAVAQSLPATVLYEPQP